jgi:sialic acid synthase SpsE
VSEVGHASGLPHPVRVEPEPAHVEVVAELTTNHFGDLHRLEHMVRAAAAAGADYVKVQRRDVASFYSAEELEAPYSSPFGTTFGDYRRQLELGDAGFDLLDTLCQELGIRWFASALDIASFDYFRDRGHRLIKIPSTVSTHGDLIAHAAARAIEVVVSTGMTDQREVRSIVEQFAAAERIHLLQCTSSYPTDELDCNVAVVRSYRDMSLVDPRIVPGYSSHDRGAYASTLAVAAGARMVEKHVKFGSTAWAHFDDVALDLATNEFAGYVREIRRAERVSGSERKRVLPSEHHKYRPRQGVSA